MHRRPFAIVVGAILCGACASPVGIRVADPLEVQRYLTRNALTAGTPSDFSLNQLRRYDLMTAFQKDPAATLARLHDIAQTQGFPSETLFALAELSFLQAEAASEQDRYVASAIYAYAFLFPEDAPTSIDNMSPGNRFIRATAQIPIAPGVIAHSIISVNDEGPLEEASDGVVKYESAHIDGVASELVVRSPHSGMQAAPTTIEEVRRIFLDHSAASACPMRTE